MKKTLMKRTHLVFALAMAFLILGSSTVQAAIDGITGPSFTLTAKADYISTADGCTVMIWGYASGTGRAQYPGPTLDVTQGQAVTVTLSNELPVPVSIVFPGQQVTAAPVAGTSADGLITLEANPGGTVIYTFTATNPGTYIYHSGTRPELEVEMGLMGALIVRPSLGPKYAYNHAGSAFDREYLFFLSEMDSRVHDVVEFLGVDALVQEPWSLYNFFSNYFADYWFINGRTGPDTMGMPNPPGGGLFPTQPYNIMPMMQPGERVLMRVVGAGRESHPFHHHGNHARVIAKDGKLLDTGAPPVGWPDLSHEVFTVFSTPGGTVDAIFEWTGKGLGWDIYGNIAHSCTPGPDGFDVVTKEWCADHGKPIPVTLPAFGELTMGPFFTGSPYLGTVALLPPGQGGFNPWGAYVFMWHSHNEKELLNYGVFPGGMMTMMVILPPGSLPIE